MEGVYLENETIAKLIGPPDERLSLLADEIVPLVNKLFQEVGRVSSRQVYYQAVAFQRSPRYSCQSLKRTVQTK
jgi:hypothetical protein